MTKLEQLAYEYWDLYKEVYGVRPRGVDTSAWTEEDFEAELRRLVTLLSD